MQKSQKVTAVCSVTNFGLLQGKGVELPACAQRHSSSTLPCKAASAAHIYHVLYLHNFSTHCIHFQMDMFLKINVSKQLWACFISVESVSTVNVFVHLCAEKLQCAVRQKLWSCHPLHLIGYKGKGKSWVKMTDAERMACIYAICVHIPNLLIS